MTARQKMWKHYEDPSQLIKHKCCMNKPLLPILWSTIQNSPGW